MLNNEKIVEIIESAFPPFRCVAEIWDYGAKLRFKIFDKEERGLFEMTSIPLNHIRTQESLDLLLQDTKLLIEEKVAALKASV